MDIVIASCPDKALILQTGPDNVHIVVSIAVFCLHVFCLLDFVSSGLELIVFLKEQYPVCDLV